jgi:hypothetical protein
MRHHRGCSNSHTCIHLIILEIPHASTAGLTAGTGQLPQAIKCTNTFTVQAPAIPRDPTSLHVRTHCRNRSQLPQGTKCANTCTAQALAIPRDPTRLHGRTHSRNGSSSPRGQSALSVQNCGSTYSPSGRTHHRRRSESVLTLTLPESPTGPRAGTPSGVGLRHTTGCSRQDHKDHVQKVFV